MRPSVFMATTTASEVRELVAYYEICSEKDVETKLRHDGARMRKQYQETE